MNVTLLARTWRSQRTKLLVVAIALAVWGSLMPIIYATFGADLRRIIEGGGFPQQFTQFGDADIFSLAGAIALGFGHPIAVALLSVFAVGFASSAVAGERQRGTLEILLARPVSRQSLFVTLLVATVAMTSLAVAAILAGSLAGAAASNVLSELDVRNVPLLWLNGVLLYGAFAAIGLAASVSFDRVTPALGITLAIVLFAYFLEIIGSLWPDAKGLQPYSLFHYLRPKSILTGDLAASHVALLIAVIAGAAAYALVVFPRRDIAAPS